MGDEKELPFEVTEQQAPPRIGGIHVEQQQVPEGDCEL